MEGVFSRDSPLPPLKYRIITLIFLSKWLIYAAAGELRLTPTRDFVEIDKAKFYAQIQFSSHRELAGMYVSFPLFVSVLFTLPMLLR
jgi:hypothetical protein